MLNNNARSFAVEPLTAKNSHPERCQNPFCNAAIKPEKGKRYCSDRCRMDGYALRRAKALFDQVGIVEFYTILRELS
jgi:predicted nucleic acid-binding Zn ribbon protein